MKKQIPRVLVVESKGKQLKGSEDTNFKRDLARIFENIGQKIAWQELGEGFRDRTFRFQILDEGEYKDKDWYKQLKHVFGLATKILPRLEYSFTPSPFSIHPAKVFI